jgi:signal transduction histidine kinase
MLQSTAPQAGRRCPRRRRGMEGFGMGASVQQAGDQGRRVGLALGNGGVGFERLLVGQVERLGQLGGWQWSIDSGRTHWSPYLFELFGRDPAGPPLAFADGHTLFTAGSWPRLQRAIEAAVAGGGGFEVEAEFARPDGGTGSVVVRGESILDSQGRTVELFGTVQDISWRKQAQQELTTTRAMLDAALASMSDPVWLGDTQGGLVEINDAFVRTHRFAGKAECLQAFSAEAPGLELQFPDGRPAPARDWPAARALRGEIGTSVEYTVQRRGGAERWVMSYSFGPVRDQAGTLLGAVVTGRDITVLRQMTASLEDSRRQLQQVLARLQRAEERERQRIARELHDDLQQLLGAIRLDLAAIGRQAGLEHTTVPALLERTAAIADLALEAVRRIVSDLRPRILDDLGLVAALESMVREFEAHSQIACELQTQGAHAADSVLSSEAATCLYRVAQEALNNVHKHAGATRVQVALDFDAAQGASLRVEDDGRGIDLADLGKSSSFGLQGMGERVSALGGHFAVEPGPAGGTRVTATLPAP